jgi:hypothetical protein
MPSRRARQYGCGGGLRRHHEFGVVCIATSDLAGLSEATPVVATIKGAPPSGTAVQPPMVRENFLVLSGCHQQRSAQNGSGDLVRRHPATTARPSGRSDLSGLLIVAAPVAAVALLAVTPRSADAAENLSRAAQEQHACAVVMGLRQPGDLYDTCVRSLAKTLFASDQARRLAADRRACSQERLGPGTPAFAVCLVNREQSPTGADVYGAPGAGH